MSLTSMALATAEQTRDIHIHPYAVGAIALVILTILMLALLSFGKGREHS